VDGSEILHLSVFRKNAKLVNKIIGVEPKELKVMVWQSLKKTTEHYAGMTDNTDAAEI
jgi:hypothetical protein